MRKTKHTPLRIGALMTIGTDPEATVWRLVELCPGPYAPIGVVDHELEKTLSKQGRKLATQYADRYIFTNILYNPEKDDE